MHAQRKREAATELLPHRPGPGSQLHHGAAGLLQKSSPCLSEGVSSTQISLICLSPSLLQAATGLLRSLWSRSDRNNKGRSGRRSQEAPKRFNRTSPACARVFALFLKTLCDVETPDVRAPLSSVSVSRRSSASHVPLLVPAFPGLRIPPPLFLMTLVQHDPISSPLPSAPLFSPNIVLTPACVCA